MVKKKTYKDLQSDVEYWKKSSDDFRDKYWAENTKLKTACQKHNDLAVKYNTLLTKWNAALLIFRD